MKIHEYIVFKQFESLISDTRNIMKPKKNKIMNIISCFNFIILKMKTDRMTLTLRYTALETFSTV